MFSNIKGQERAINILKNIISSEKIAQSYLFYGLSGIGKLTTAFEFAKAVNCSNQKNYDCCDNCSSCHKIDHFSHPDIHFVFPTPKYEISADGEYKKEKDQLQVQNFIEQMKFTPYLRYQFSKATSIQIDTIRNLERKICFKPNEGKYRIIIIVEADKMTRGAANAFLKTLEEPPNYAIIILTTTKFSALLPTIISRCQKIKFNSVSSEIIENHLIKNYNVDKIQAKIISRISNGNVAKAISMSQTEIAEARDIALDFINFIIEKDFKGINDFSDNFSQNRNEDLLKEILDFIILWFGDLIYLIYNSEKIVNIDQKDNLMKFYQKTELSEKNIREIIDLIEKAKHLISGHINFELIAIDTFFQIYKRVYQNQKR